MCIKARQDTRDPKARLQASLGEVKGFAKNLKLQKIYFISHFLPENELGDRLSDESAVRYSYDEKSVQNPL